MNKNAFAAIALVPALAFAAPSVSTNADYVAGENSQALVTPELCAMAEQMFGAQAGALLHAVRLNMAAYDLDMRTPQGRSRWHGRLVREEVDTNALVKVEVYTNDVTGATWRYRLPFRPKSAAVKAYRPPKIGTNGVPAALSAARARRNAELAEGTKTVTVDVQAN